MPSLPKGSDRFKCCPKKAPQTCTGTGIPGTETGGAEGIAGAGGTAGGTAATNDESIQQCVKLDLLSIIRPTPGEVSIFSKYNSSCCPFPDGVLQFPICSWFASPNYFYPCWRIRQRCCGVKCLYSDDRKHCCADNKLGVKQGKHISTNTLHGVTSVNDLRAWSMCCEDKRRYFLDQMLSFSKSALESNDDDAAEQEFVESGANSVEARYESLLSRKDDEIERLKKQLLALGVKPAPRAEGAAELGRATPSKTQQSSGSESSQRGGLPAATSKQPTPKAGGAAELGRSMPSPRQESSGNEGSSPKKASTKRPKSKGSGEPQVAEDVLWDGLFGIPEEDENPSSNPADGVMAQETSPAGSQRNSDDPMAQGTSPSRSPRDSNEPMSQGTSPAGSQRNSDDPMAQGTSPSRSPRDSNEPMSQGTSPAGSTRNSDDPMAQQTSPARSQRNSPAGDALAQDTDPKKPSSNSTASGTEDVAPEEPAVKPPVQVQFDFAFNDGTGNNKQPAIAKILKMQDGQVIEELDPTAEVPYDDGDFEFEFELPEENPPPPPPPPPRNYTNVMRQAADTINQLNQTIQEMEEDRRREVGRNGRGDFF